jgi:membrane associated rhomboid family serine protease
MGLHPNTRQFFRIVAFPLLFMVILWAIRFADEAFDLNLVRWGIFPRRISGLPGIILSPLIHASYTHLISNSVPLLFLGLIMFYFYREVAFTAFFWVYISTGIWVWIAGREAYHVGASGLIYSFVCFLFYSGIFRRKQSLMALSLLMIFLYGGLIWGILPLQPKISWETHLLGAVAGFVIAFFLRKEGPQREKYDWEDEPDEEDEMTVVKDVPQEEEVKIRYLYKPNDSSSDDAKVS